MKFLLGLCALFFASQANAATFNFTARADIQAVQFYDVRWVTYDDPPDAYDIGRITVTNNSGQYGFYHEFLEFFDRPAPLLSFEIETDDAGGISNVNSCALGPMGCPSFNGLGGFWESGSTVRVMWLNSYPDRILMSFDYQTGLGNLEVFFDRGINGSPTAAGYGYDIGVAGEFTLTALPVPLPAGGVLLVTAFAGLSLCRRSRSRCRPQQAL